MQTQPHQQEAIQERLLLQDLLIIEDLQSQILREDPLADQLLSAEAAVPAIRHQARATGPSARTAIQVLTTVTVPRQMKGDPQYRIMTDLPAVQASAADHPAQ